MKIRFINKAIKINEADTQRGKLLNDLTKLEKKINSELTGSAYSVKFDSDKFFYLRANSNTIATIKLKLIPDSDNKFTVDILDTKGNKINLDSAHKTSSLEKIIEEDALYIADIISKQFISKEKITEANIFTSIANKIKDTLDKKSAKKADKKSIDDILNDVKEKIISALNLKIKGDANSKIKIESNIIDKSEVQVLIKTPFILAAKLEPDDNSITISKIIFPNNTSVVTDKIKTIDDLLKKLNKILNLKINLELDSTSSDSSSETASDESSDTSSNYRDRLINSIGSDIINPIVAESLINEQKYKSSKYTEAWNKVSEKDLNARLDFIRFFMYEETNGILGENSIDNDAATDILKCALDGNPNGFNLGLNYRLQILINYALINDNTKFISSSDDIRLIRFMNEYARNSSTIESLSKIFNKNIDPNITSFNKRKLAPFYIKDFFKIYSLNDASKFCTNFKYALDAIPSIDFKSLNSNKELKDILELDETDTLNAENIIEYIFTQNNTFRKSVQEITNILNRLNIKVTHKEDSEDTDSATSFTLSKPKLNQFLSDIDAGNVDKKYFRNFYSYLNEPSNMAMLKKVAKLLKDNIDTIIS